ncbi:hypothetical protein GU926_05900 [Nibribacter ruber]|uniref:Uncharacterized protein n=1 Tax=Nibribacter ruber TaxID=2698458 RepID=A0A6P1P1B7_9BACT|nr:hypothetical protein [Nibribacter ruber]QHL86992.1 hypothetical protein GU926_05900 [Nibribacter ruber]
MKLLFQLLGLVGTVVLLGLATLLFQLINHSWILILLLVSAYVIGKLLQKRATSEYMKALGWGIRWGGVASFLLFMGVISYLYIR